MSDNATIWSQWDNMILQIVDDALEELGVMVKDKLVSNIDECVYVGQNQIYEPTYEFRESWEVDRVSTGRDIEVEISSNPDKMNVDIDNYVHGSRFQDRDIREFLPEILALNLSGDLFGVNKWWQNRDDYFQKTMDDLKKNGWLSKTFKSLLRQRGLTVI